MERKPIVSPRTYTYSFKEFEVTLMLEKALRGSTQEIPKGKCKLEVVEPIEGIYSQDKIPERTFNLVLTEELKDELPKP